MLVKAAEQINYYLITFLLDLPPALLRRDDDIVGIAPISAFGKP